MSFIFMGGGGFLSQIIDVLYCRYFSVNEIKEEEINKKKERRKEEIREAK